MAKGYELRNGNKNEVEERYLTITSQADIIRFVPTPRLTVNFKMRMIEKISSPL